MNRPAAQTKNHDIIQVEGLTVGYGSTNILENISFSVVEGDIFAILGTTGCGKTTLLKTLIGLIAPRRGRINIGGVELGPETDREALSKMREQIGVSFQSDALLNWLTVEENVAFPLREYTDLPDGLIRQVVRLKLELVNMEKYAKLMPSELSGGMKRRAGLAMAMAMDPKILYCDEPTSGLDPVTAREIDQLLIELNKFLNITTVVVTHEIESLENISSYCIMLDKETKGIIASGTVEELENNPENEQVRSFFQRRIQNRSEKKSQ